MNRAGLLLAYSSLLAVACFGLFVQLDDRLLWADEAETAFLATSITKFGVPIADDGSNDLSRTRPGSKNAAGVWVWSPWLDEYVMAASFALFGKSTLSARLPFAVLGLLAFGLLGWIAWRASRSHEVALVVLTLGVTNVAWLLHARQARYYAVILLAQLGVVYGMQRLVESASLRAALLVAGSLVAMFYCNYIVVPANVIGIVAATWLLRSRNDRMLRSVAISLAGFALGVLPWLLYARAGGQAEQLGVSNFLSYLVYYVGELHFHTVSLAVFLLPLLVGWIERRWSAVAPDRSQLAWEWSRDLRTILVCLLVAQLLFLCFAPDRFFRYLTPTLPLVLLLAGFIVVRFVRPVPVRVAVVALLATTNVLSTGLLLPFPKRHATAAPYVTFAQSITRDYEDRFEAVLAELGEEIEPGDTVYVDDHELPLIFYTDARVILARDAQLVWQRPPAEHPDWVMPSPPSALLDPKQLGFRPGPAYQRGEIAVPRSRRGGSRPHPDAHEFFSSPVREPFVYYRKKTRNSAEPR